MRTKRWTSDCGEKWYELREDGTFHSFKGVQLKVHNAKGISFIVFYLNTNGKYKRFYMSMRRAMVETFIENPHGYKFTKFLDDNPHNYHYTNLKPVKTRLESLTTQAHKNMIEGMKKAEETRRKKEEEFEKKRKEGKSTRAILSRINKELEYKAKIKNGKLPPSRIEDRERRTKEKFMGYMPKVGLFGKKLLKEEPKLDHNFKPIR